MNEFEPTAPQTALSTLVRSQAMDLANAGRATAEELHQLRAMARLTLRRGWLSSGELIATDDDWLTPVVGWADLQKDGGEHWRVFAAAAARLGLTLLDDVDRALLGMAVQQLEQATHALLTLTELRPVLDDA